jgi:DNA-binding transcriptional ArsR family regulator
MKRTATLSGVDLSAVGALLADPARTAILVALWGGVAMPAGDLAHVAGVTPSTASIHLVRLLDAGWVVVERRGRHRYYRLASARVATLLEQVAQVAPAIPVRSFRGRQETDDLRRARSCYDHMAGQIGVALTDALIKRGVLRVQGLDFALTRSGAAFLGDRGVDVPAPSTRRAFARRCLDWSERRDHLAGALGAAVFAAWETRGWVVRRAGSRALRLTAEGVAQLPEWGVPWPPATVSGPAAHA